MVYHNNKNSREQRDEIDALLGKTFGLVENFSMGGKGSPRILVQDAHPKLLPLLGHGDDRRHINIELRPKGIIVFFRNHVNDFIWPIPYYQLSLFAAETFNIHAHGLNLKLARDEKKSGLERFYRKLMEQRSTVLDG